MFPGRVSVRSLDFPEWYLRFLIPYRDVRRLFRDTPHHTRVDLILFYKNVFVAYRMSILCLRAFGWIPGDISRTENPYMVRPLYISSIFLSSRLLCGRAGVFVLPLVASCVFPLLQEVILSGLCRLHKFGASRPFAYWLSRPVPIR